MNIVPKGAAAPAAPDTSQSSRAKAIAAYNTGVSSFDAPAPHSQPQTQVLRNQNQVSAEELGAIQSPSAPMEEILTPPSIPEPQIEEKKVEDPALSRQFAQLARQERALRQKQQQQEQSYKVREAELAARQAEIEAKSLEYNKNVVPLERLKTDPIRAFLEAGGTYDELTQHLLNTPTNPLDPRVEIQLQKQQDTIEKLQRLIDEQSNSAKQSQQHQYDAAVKQIRTDAQALVKNDPNFETIRATGSVNEVVDLIVKTFNDDGVLMSVEEAAEEVESYLLDETLRLSRLDKVQKRLQANAKPASTPAPAQTQQVQTQAQSKPTMKTLTNATGSTRPLSARERAVLAFKGQLK